MTWLAEGQRPPPDIVRPEEFVNWFDYGYARPDAGWASAVDGVATTPWNDATSLLRIGLVTAAVDPAARPDVTLTFVVDTSGSMAGTPLDTVQRSLDLLVTQLRPSDRIGLVEYGSQARTILAPTSLAEAGVVRDAIARLRTNGSTNVGDGLRTGYDLARRNRTPGGIDMVVLASDGVANTGVTEAEGILELVGAGVDEGIGLLALGVDERGFNDQLMETLTNRGDGTTYYLRSPADAERLFVEELEQTLVVAARDSKVQVAFDPDAVTSYRLIGYDNRAVADEDFRDDTVDAGEVGAGHEVTAMYEVELRPGVTADVVLADLQLRWQDVASGRVREAVRPVTAGELTPDATTRFGTAVQAVTLAEVLRGSPYLDVSLDGLVGFAEWGTSDEATEAIRMAAAARAAPGG
jgi:Ca-activated chloride channel family protein